MASTSVRIGDAERERAVSDLGDHFAAGRLTRDELDERLDQAWNAKTGADLRPLFADLPGAVVSRPTGRRTEAGASRLTGPSWFRGTSRSSGSPGFPLPLLAIVAIVLTIITHVPFILFFAAWFVLSRLVVGGRHHRQYAFRP